MNKQNLSQWINAADKITDVIILILAALIFFVSGYSLYDNYRIYKGASDRTVLTYKPALEEPDIEFRRISEDQAFWLTVYDTNIDYPVMQGEDNFEYLNKDPYGEFKLSGSIYLDYQNDPELMDEYSLLYGHHMEHGAMFGSLDEYNSPMYFDHHREGRIVTPERSYGLTIFAVCHTNASDKILFQPKGRTAAEVLEHIRARASIWEQPPENSRIIAFSTCASYQDASRLLVFASLREK